MIIDKSILDAFIQDPNDKITTLNLAEQYMLYEHYSAAITYFIKSAEACDEEDYLIKYHCLLSIAECYRRLGNRTHGVLQYCRFAKAECPDRPEAYYLMADTIAQYLVSQGKFELDDWIKVYENSRIGAIFGKVREFGKSRYYNGVERLYVIYAMSLLRLGKVKECIEFLEQTDFKQLDDPYVTNTLKNICRELKIEYPY